MSKTFKVPVLIKVAADSQKEAEAIAYRFMSAAGEATLNHEPVIHKSIKWWELADAAIKARKPK